MSIVLDISNESDSVVEISDDAFYLLTDAVHVLIGADDSATAKICIEESKTLKLKFPALPQKMKTVTLVCGLHFPQYMLTFEQGVPQSA